MVSPFWNKEMKDKAVKCRYCGEQTIAKNGICTKCRNITFAVWGKNFKNNIPKN